MRPVCSYTVSVIYRANLMHNKRSGIYDSSLANTLSSRDVLEDSWGRLNTLPLTLLLNHQLQAAVQPLGVCVSAAAHALRCLSMSAVVSCKSWPQLSQW